MELKFGILCGAYFFLCLLIVLNGIEIDVTHANIAAFVLLIVLNGIEIAYPDLNPEVLGSFNRTKWN